MKKKKIFTMICAINLLCAFISCVKPGDDEFQQALKEYGKQNYDIALDLFEQALAQESNYSKEIVYSMMANVHIARQDFSSAVQCYQNALAEKPDYRIFCTLGALFKRIGDDVAAEKAYLDAIAFDSKRPEAYASLGALYLGKENVLPAIELLEKAKNINPKLSVVHANLAVAYAMQKNSVLAMAELSVAEQYKCENLEQFRTRVSELLQ